LVPFDPIHPGTLHADHFSPLNGDHVTVPDLLVDKFDSFLLDFASLNSDSSVHLNLPGGLHFNNENFEISGEGSISISSDVNNININAPRGEARFHGNTLDVTSTGGDVRFQSLEGNVFIAAGVGSVNFNAPAWNAISEYSNTTVSIHSEGEFNLQTGGDFLPGNVNFDGGNLFFNSDFANFLTPASIAFHALDQLGFIADGDVEVSASGPIDILTNSGFLSIESASVDIQAPFFKIASQGATSVKSVLGKVSFESGFSNILSLDQVKIGSKQDGVFLKADNNVFFSIGNAIRWGTSADYSLGSFASLNMNLQSDKGGVNWNTFDNLDFEVIDDTNLFAGNNLYATAQGTMVWETTADIQLQAGRDLQFSATDLLSMDGGEIFFNQNNNQYILALDYAQFSAPTVNFNIKSTAAFDLNTNAFSMTASQTISFEFDNHGTISGTDSISLESLGPLVFNTNRETVDSTDSIYVEAGSKLTVTTNGGDVTIISPVRGKYTSSDLVITANVGTLDANFISNSAQETRFTVTSRADWNAGDDFKASGATELSFDFNSQSYSSIGGAVELQSDSAAFYNVENQISYKSNFGDIALNAVDMQIESGDFLASGPNLSVTIPDSGWVGSRSATVTAANGPITMHIGQNGLFEARGELNVHSDSKTTFLADNMDIEASDFFEGDITFRAGSNAITLSTSNFQVAADGLGFSSGSTTTIRANNFLIDHKSLQDLSKDYGDVEFDADGNFQQITQFTITQNQRDAEYYGDSLVSVQATNQLGITTLDDAIFQAERGVNWNSDTLLVSSTNITISGVESAQFKTIGLLTLDTTGETSVTTSNDSAFRSGQSLTLSTAQGTEVYGEENILIQGSPQRIQSTTLSYYETSGGGTFTSGLSTTFIAREYFQAQTEDLLTIESKASTITATAQNGDLHLLGGEITGTATAGIAFTANGFLNGIAYDYGSVIFDAGQSFVSTTINNFNWYGQSTDLISTPGRYGTMLAKNDNVCFNSDFRRANIADAPNTGTSFIGDSLVASANGPDGTMVWNATSSIRSNSDESIGITAYGWILDPEFVLDDDDSVEIEVDDVDTFGVLFRTDVGPVSLDSAGAGLNMYSWQNLTALSEFGELSSTTTEILDIRTFDFDSNIYVTATNGNVGLSAARGYTITAGNPLLPADLVVNATRNILFDSDRGAVWNNLGTNTVTDNLGIYIESYGDSILTATQDFNAVSELGGTLYFEARDGKISSASETGNAKFVARTGSVNMLARGTASFMSVEDIIAIQANGDGGSVFINSGADEDTTINAGVGHIFVDSLQGEVDLNAYDGIIANVGTDFNLQGPCVNYKGGNIENNADLITFTTDQHLSFQAAVELTMDAQQITFASSLSPVNFNAGGDGVAAGLSITSIGNVLFESTTTQNWASVNYVASSASVIDFTSSNDVLISSSLDSSAQDNILIQSQNVEITLTGARIDKFASLLAQTKSLSLGVENAQDIFYQAARETRFEFQADFTQTTTGGSLQNLAGNMQNILSGSASFTSDSGSLGFTADESYSIDVTNAVDWSSVNTHILSEAFESAIEFYSDSNLFTLSQKFTIFSKLVQVVGSEDGISLDATKDFDSSSASSTNLLSVNQLSVASDVMTVTADQALVKSGGSFTADNQATTSFTGTNLLVSAFGDIAFNGQTTTITPAAGQPASFVSGNDLNVRADGDVSFKGTRLDFTATEERQNPAIRIDSPDIQTTSNRFSVSSKADIAYTAGDTLTVDSPAQIFSSTGPNGILLDNAAMQFDAATGFNVNANRGNVFMNSEATLAVNSVGASFESSHEFGAINLVLLTSIAPKGGEHLFDAANVYFESIGDFTRFKNGFIHVEAFNTVLNAPILDLIAEDDVQLFAKGAIDFTGTDYNMLVGNLAKFTAHNSITVTAVANADLATSRLSLVNNQDVNAIHFNTDVFSSVQETSTSFNVDVDALIHSQSFVNIAFADGTFDGAVQSYKATAGDMLTNASGDLALTAGRFSVKSVSADGTSSFGGTTSLDIDAQTFGDFQATDSIWLPADVWTLDNLEARSAGGVWFEAADIAFTSERDTLLEATADGIIDILTFDTLSFTGTGTLNLRAEGNLGSQGGRYVLEDFYNEGSDIHFDRNHRVNVNTNAMEFTAVNGYLTGHAELTMSFTARHGSIEARCPRVMRYFVTHSLSIPYQIMFYGLDDGAPTVPSATYPAQTIIGTHKQVPYAFANDYCETLATEFCVDSGGTCSLDCTELSQVINEITRMLVAYGFLECTIGSNFCFP